MRLAPPLAQVPYHRASLSLIDKLDASSLRCITNGGSLWRGRRPVGSDALACVRWLVLVADFFGVACVGRETVELFVRQFDVRHTILE